MQSLPYLMSPNLTTAFLLRAVGRSPRKLLAAVRAGLRWPALFLHLIDEAGAEDARWQGEHAEPQDGDDSGNDLAGHGDRMTPEDVYAGGVRTRIPSRDGPRLPRRSCTS